MSVSVHQWLLFYRFAKWNNSYLDEVSNARWNGTCNSAAALCWLFLIWLPLVLSVLINASHIFTLRVTCGFLSLSLCYVFYQLLKATIPTSTCSFLSMTSSKFLSPGHFHKLSLTLRGEVLLADLIQAVICVVVLVSAVAPFSAKLLFHDSDLRNKMRH